jgi:hypothetical protein
MSLTDNDDDGDFVPETGRDNRGGLMVALPDGSYTYIPDLTTFCADNKASMVSLEPDGHIAVLRMGPKKKYGWVYITEESD